MSLDKNDQKPNHVRFDLIKIFQIKYHLFRGCPGTPFGGKIPERGYRAEQLFAGSKIFSTITDTSLRKLVAMPLLRVKYFCEYSKFELNKEMILDKISNLPYKKNHSTFESKTDLE